MNSGQGSQLGSVEEYLGPAEENFFLHGYRSVIQDVAGGLVSPDSFAGTGSINYPPDWSTSTEGARHTPHLGMLDATILPLLAIGSAWGFRKSEYISEIQLRAGSSPWLECSKVPVATTLSPSAQLGHGDRKFATQTGGFRGSLTLTSPRSASGDSSWMDSSDDSTYRTQFRQTYCETTLGNYDPGSGSLGATHDAHSLGSARVGLRSGLEDHSRPALTVIDYEVMMAQIMQILVAKRDRAKTPDGSLWMRSVRMKFSRPPGPLPTSFSSETKPVRERVVDQGGRHIFHVIAQTQTSNGVHISSDAAYVEES